jgi:hypothetical protein
LQECNVSLGCRKTGDVIARKTLLPDLIEQELQVMPVAAFRKYLTLGKLTNRLEMIATNDSVHHPLKP